MMTDFGVIPAEVQDLVNMAHTSVSRVIGVAPDLTPDTLPLVDQYLREFDPASTPEVKSLVVSAAGCYFGEVARRVLHGRWALPSPAPESWRIELVECFLHFTPVGMAGEVLTRTQNEDHDGSFATLDLLSDALDQMLSTAAPFSEDEFFSLSGRMDILQLVADWLIGQVLASGKERRSFSAEDYSLVLDREHLP